MSDNPRDHEVTAALAQLRPRHQLDPAAIAFRAGQMSRRSELRFWRAVAGLALALAAIGWLLPFLRPSAVPEDAATPIVEHSPPMVVVPGASPMPRPATGSSPDASESQGMQPVDDRNAELSEYLRLRQAVLDRGWNAIPDRPMPTAPPTSLGDLGHWLESIP